MQIAVAFTDMALPFSLGENRNQRFSQSADVLFQAIRVQIPRHRGGQGFPQRSEIVRDRFQDRLATIPVRIRAGDGRVIMKTGDGLGHFIDMPGFQSRPGEHLIQGPVRIEAPHPHRMGQQGAGSAEMRGLHWATDFLHVHVQVRRRAAVEAEFLFAIMPA